MRPDPRHLHADDFAYDLPDARIARHPLEDRAASRLLLRRADGSLHHHRFRDVPDLVPPGAVLVLNETRVIQARLSARKPTGAAVEVFLLQPASEPMDPALALAQRSGVAWQALLGGKKIRAGDELVVDGVTPARARVVERTGAGAVIFLAWDGDMTLAQWLEESGKVPLPPYLARDAVPADRARYQTVYARDDGSVAAPTAGLHFTPALLDALRARDVRPVTITLHVGAGTFRPMQADTVGAHDMHAERFRVARAALAQLRDAHRQGRPVIAVGTTSLRTLESLHALGAMVHAGDRDAPSREVPQWSALEPAADVPPADALGALLDVLDGAEHLHASTRLMLAPGCPVRTVDALFTNFHQQRSTLLCLVAALVGHPAWKDVYAEALRQDYRFLSYGDGSLLWLRAPRVAPSGE